jgi:hypothetical protein
MSRPWQDAEAQMARTGGSRRGLLGVSAVVGMTLGLATGIKGVVAGSGRCKDRLAGMTQDVRAMGQDIRELEDIASVLSRIPGAEELGTRLVSVASELERKRTKALNR